MRKFNVKVNGKSFEVEVEEVGGSASPVSAPVVSAPVAPAAPAKAASTAGTKVAAPMPGLIIALKVADGTSVKKDQPIVVLEAMKMENDIVAPCDGVVHYVTTKGANVDSGDVLATIE